MKASKKQKNSICNTVKTSKTIISRINIDSRNRNTESRNILEGAVHYLKTNPLHISYSESYNTKLIVTHENHPFEINDSIIMQGVKSTTISLTNGLTFISNSSFVRINHKNHNLNFDTTNDIYINITGFIGNKNGNCYFNNIPINVINNLHKLYEVREETEIGSNDYYYINMNNVNSNFSSTYSLSSLKIVFNDINGIDLSFLNANYPIDINHKQGYHSIVDVTDDTYTIHLNINNDVDISSCGGSNVWVAKINGFIPGYTNNNNYKIPLKRTFLNVKEIKLLSTEFPNTEKIIKSYGVKKNNMFYWKNENDGETIYSIEIDAGNYSSDLLKSEMENKINKTKRETLTIINQNNVGVYSYDEYNDCEIVIETKTNYFEIVFYSTIFIADAFTYRSGDNFDDGNDRMHVTHYNHNLVAGSVVTINNALSTQYIPEFVLNSSFEIEKVINDSMYRIKIPKHNKIDSLVSSKGGSSMSIKFPVKVQLFFDKNDTIGSILGFRHVGKNNAITNFNYINSNKISYMTDYIIEGQTINNTINLSGDNYILMTNPIFTDSYNSGNVSNIFAKLPLNSNPGEMMYNDFIQLGQYFNPPLPELYEWQVAFYDANDELFEFGDIEHSYTLEIHEDYEGESLDMNTIPKY